MSPITGTPKRIPTPADILGIVQRLEPISLKHLCHQLYPELPWLPLRPGHDSARLTPRPWIDDTDQRSVTLTAAEYLYARCQSLVTRGWLRPGPANQADADPLAGHTYCLNLTPPVQLRHPDAGPGRPAGGPAHA